MFRIAANALTFALFYALVTNAHAVAHAIAIASIR